MATSPTFFSEDLQKAVDAARPTLEGLDETRNRVSRDIKALEAYLQTLNLKESFRHSLGQSFVSEEGEDQHLAASLEYGGCASGTIEEEALSWSIDSKGRQRLFFEVNRWDGEVNIDAPGGPYFWDETTLKRESTPLIEAKFEIRKRIYSALPSFVAALEAHLRILPDKPMDLDDIPF